MRRAWIWGLLLWVVTSCAEKAPPEGAVRVAVRYGSYPPACVRVVARDDLGHEGSTDIIQAQFNNAREQRVRVAVFRKADWGRQLTVEASSFTRSADAKCSGTRVETFSKRVEVPLGDYAPFEAVLEATDEDQDGSPALTRSAEGLDCDDGRADVFPGAEERCGVGVDYDCDGFAGCQDTKCLQKACDDGNACTTGEVCVGSGTMAQCVGRAVVCPQPEGRCVTGSRCVQETGACVVVRKECTAPGSVCLEGAGVCNESTGNCEYKPKPAATSCDDSQVCTTGEQCNGQGSCLGTRSTCTTSNPCFRAAGSCPAAGDCREELDPAKVDTACPIANETLGGRCRVVTGKCSRFPYEPSHFDPDTVPSARIVDLTLTCNVTFDSTALSWTPANCVTSAPTPFELTQGAEAAVLLPILNLSMNGTLKLVGNRPVIFAVFGNATLTQDLLANGTGTTPGAGGNVTCDTRRGRGGVVGASVGGGGGGAGGGLTGPGGGKGSTPGALPGDGGGTATTLAGGCPGGSGGGDTEGGSGGAGGGMVQVSVAGTLTVNKAISVSGGGGGGGGTSQGGETGGGGGGGGGGRILLEAQQVVMANAARLTANGGGGGKGGAYRASNDRASGNGGMDGYVFSESAAPGATSGNNSGGNGGAGGGRDRPAEAGKESTPVGNDVRGGGGGGGGAVGVIRLRSQRPCALNNAVFSPNIDRQCPL